MITVNCTVRSLAPQAFQGFSFCQKSWKLKNSWWILFASWSLGFKSRIFCALGNISSYIVILLPDEYVLSRNKFYATFFVTTWNFRMSLKTLDALTHCWKIIWTLIKTISGVIHHWSVAFSDPVETLEQRWPHGIIICWWPTQGLRHFKRFFKPLSVSNIPLYRLSSFVVENPSPRSSMSVASTQPPTSLTFIYLLFGNSKEL